MCSMVKLMVGTTLEIHTPSTLDGSSPSCLNRLMNRIPYSSEEYILLVDTRQYLTISSPLNRAVLMLVLPISRVRIMPGTSLE